MKNISIRMLSLSGIFASLIFVFTAFVHIPLFYGYVHIGDAFLFLAASLLPTPYAIFAAVFGAVLADCLSGFAIYAPATLIIKLLCVLFFTRKKTQILAKRNLLALLPAAGVSIGGYYLFEAILYANYLTPAYAALGNLGQAVFSAILFVLLGSALDKIKIKEKLQLTTSAGI